MAMWVLTRNRPTGPRRGTNVLILGSMSLLFGAGALVVHSWVGTSDWPPVAILITRIATFLVPLAWAGFTVAAHREEKRTGTRTYGAKIGLALLAVFTVGACGAMLSGLLDSISAVTG